DGEAIFETGQRFSLDILRGENAVGVVKTKPTDTKKTDKIRGPRENSFWHRVHSLEEGFRRALEDQNPRQSANALLELDRTIWQAQQDLESEEFITQARDTLRELMVLLGNRLAGSPGNKAECLAPLVDALLELRQQFRDKKQWQVADAIRDSLQTAGILIEDSPNGHRWQLKS
ncbi:MAG: hypothetical protein PVI06_14080, partial [Desulfobacterales bacterium]